MRRLARPFLLAAAAALAPAAAHGQSAQRPPDGYGPEIIVRARPRVGPQVAATFPAQGAQTAAGTLVLTVRFSQPMTDKGWSYARLPGAAFPRCLPEPRLLPDGRTFVLLCAVTAGASYGVGLNTDPAEGFADPFHRFAPPYALHFTTAAGGEPVRAVGEALKAAGLQPQDGPIMTWQGHAGDADLAQRPPPRGD